MTEALLLAKAADRDLLLLPAMANRHGLIAGATGTGKTITLQVLAQAFSRIGVPVFMADVKGDLSGLAAAGKATPKLAARLQSLGLQTPQWQAAPVAFWDVYGKAGHPVRATMSELGPLLLGRMLNLNDTQQGVLTLVFKVADDNGMLLLDLKDLRAMLQYVGDNAASFKTDTPASRRSRTAQRPQAPLGSFSSVSGLPSNVVSSDFISTIPGRISLTSRRTSSH